MALAWQEQCQDERNLGSNNTKFGQNPNQALLLGLLLPVFILKEMS